MKERTYTYTSKTLVEQTEQFQVWLYEYRDHRTVYVVPRNSNDKTVVLKIGHKWIPVPRGNHEAIRKVSG